MEAEDKEKPKVRYGVYLDQDLLNRFHAVVLAEKQKGNRQASVNKHAVAALEAYIEKIERRLGLQSETNGKA